MKLGLEKMTNYTSKLELYNKLIENHPDIERKGKTMPYTSVNGHMFSFLDKEGNMGLRLSKIDRDDFIAKFDSELMVQYGSIMKEYVVIPANLLEDTKTLQKYLQTSFDYVSSLKPKPTKKK